MSVRLLVECDYGYGPNNERMPLLNVEASGSPIDPDVVDKLEQAFDTFIKHLRGLTVKVSESVLDGAYHITIQTTNE